MKMANNSVITTINLDSRLDFIKCFNDGEVDFDTPLNIIVQDAPVWPNNNNNHNHNNNNNNHHHQLDLPKPSFRPAQNSYYKNRRYIAASKSKKDAVRNFNKEGYYKYDEPTPDDLKDRVEYDMDEADSHWLKLFNENNMRDYNYSVTEADFEKIMDRLEKESSFESRSSGKDVVPGTDDDAECVICSDGNCTDANQILFCDMCDIAVHQECYGVPYIPEGRWLCRRCLMSPSENVSCCLCPNKGGAFKQTDDNRWAHVLCALWIPEVTFANTVFLEPIDALDQIPAARWKLTCYICKQKRNGACIQCHKSSCYVPFHVTCAQIAGLYMKFKSERINGTEGAYDITKEAFCDQHAPAESHTTGMYLDNDEVIVTDEKKYKKWQKGKRDKMKSTRKILAEKRQRAFDPVAEPKVDEEKLAKIAELLPCRKRNSKSASEFEKIRLEILGKIKGYWIDKRKARKGVPLIRRLQVSFSNTRTNTTSDLKDDDALKYKLLRFDLEKTRLLVGDTKKREVLKLKMIHLSRDIARLEYDYHDKKDPPMEE